jgi:CRP/FNR family transcriptional regulator, cyclic AMP receptor protein
MRSVERGSRRRVVARPAHRLDEIAIDGVRSGFLFALPGSAAEALLSEAIRMDVPAGALIYRDDESPRVFVVLDGLVRVFLSSPEGRQVTVRYARAGDVAGLVLVIGGPAPESIQAMTSASVVAFRAATLRALIATDPGVASACAEELTRQLNTALADLSEQAFSTVRQRLVRQLLDLASMGSQGRLAVRASQQELADAVASVREVVTRNLHQLAEDGLIGVGRDEIVLLDPGRLAVEVSEPWFRAGAAPEGTGGGAT